MWRFCFEDTKETVKLGNGSAFGPFKTKGEALDALTAEFGATSPEQLCYELVEDQPASDTYVAYLEALALSLLTERKSKEDIYGIDFTGQPVTYSPDNAIEYIKKKTKVPLARLEEKRVVESTVPEDYMGGDDGAWRVAGS